MTGDTHWLCENGVSQCLLVKQSFAGSRVNRIK